MSEALNEYRKWEAELIRVRATCDGLWSPEEDIILEGMVDVWPRLTPEERMVIDAEPPRSLIRPDPMRSAP